MSTPSVLINGYSLDDGLFTDGCWTEITGLFEPAVVARGARIDTFGGPVAIRSQPTIFEPRQISLKWYLLAGNGYTENYQRAHDLLKDIQGRPCEIQAGSLYLLAELGTPSYDRFRAHQKRVDIRVDAEAIPATWFCKYGRAVGADQGIYVADDRLDSPYTKASSSETTSGYGSYVNTSGYVVQFTNPGSAPCFANVLISGLTASTTYYIANTRTGETVGFSTGSGETVKYLPGLVALLPGDNVLRLQTNTSGTLVGSGTIVWSIYGTEFRYLGNDDNKFTEGPAVFRHHRRGGATYVSASTPTISSVNDRAARSGLPTGTTSYTAAKAGLILEGSTTNAIDNPDVESGEPTLNATAFDTRVTSDQSTAQKVAGSNSLLLTTTGTGGANADNFYQMGSGDSLNGLTAGSTYTFSAWVYVPSSTGPSVANVYLRFYYVDGGTTTTTSTKPTAQDTWQFIWLTVTIPAGATAAYCRLYVGQAADGLTVYYDNIQLEARPFPTSFVNGSRQADHCAVARPHNYLKYSRNQTQATDPDTSTAGPWLYDGTSAAIPTRAGTGSDGTTVCTWNIVNADNRLYQRFTPDVRPNSTAWTFIVALRQGTMTGANAIQIRIGDQDGNTLGSAVTITASDLSASETRTFHVTVTAAQVDAADTGLECRIKGGSGTGTIIIDWTAMVQGSLPGPFVHTEGSNVPLPEYGWEWPDYITQNGYVEFDAVLPPISTGLTYYIFGDATNDYVALLRHTSAGTGSNELRIRRKANGGSQTVTITSPGSVFDGALRTFRVEWVNYTLSGTQYMYLRLYVDGTQVSSDSNLASSTVTEWSTPDRMWLSDGSVYATIRDFSFGVASLPSGAIPAT